jgi:hypothetical protein
MSIFPKIALGVVVVVLLVAANTSSATVSITKSMVDDPNDLHSAMIFDSKPYPADGDECQLVWTNHTGRRILIRKSYLWAGMFKDGVADIDVQIERGDGSIVAKLQWDHYADPVGPVARDDYFTPYMVLGAGESLTMTYRAASIVTPTVAHVQFVVWWTQD